MFRTKRALLIGINYTGTDSELRGCINDVTNVKQMLMSKFGYHDTQITILTDNTDIKPTRNNILRHLFELILSNNSDLYFHYSGHGSQIRDLSGDESDGMDEALVPIDYQESGMISDDELRGLLHCMQETCKLTMVLDCCHSGSGVDLAYNLYERTGRNYLLEDPVNRRIGKTRGQVVCFSGCMDSQTSADAYIGTQYQGALTNYYLSALNTLTPRLRTLNNIYNSIKTGLKNGKYTQIPCLSSGNMIDINAGFSL